MNICTKRGYLALELPTGELGQEPRFQVGKETNKQHIGRLLKMKSSLFPRYGLALSLMAACGKGTQFTSCATRMPMSLS